MIKEGGILILSGGLDSVVLLHKLINDKVKNLHALIFDYGQRHHSEIANAVYNCEKFLVPYKIIKINFDFMNQSSLVNHDIETPNVVDDLGNPQPVTYVPNRNMIMLSYAVAYAESVGVGKVYYGAQAADINGYWDCTPVFVSHMNNVLSLNRKDPISIETPFVNSTKTDIVKIGIELKVDFRKTTTCYDGNRVACGICSSCSSRIAAFLANGYIDPIEYEIDIPWGNAKELI